MKSEGNTGYRPTRLCHNVFARESNDRRNLVSNRHHRDCHVHCRELAMTNEDYDTVSYAGMTKVVGMTAGLECPLNYLIEHESVVL